MRVYLAGPMTGLPEFNYPCFRAAAKRLRAAGYWVENPADNLKPICGTWTGWMRKGITQLVKCDAIVMLPGWQQSRGASIEHELACGLGFAVMQMPADDAPVQTPDAFRTAWFDAGSRAIVGEALTTMQGSAREQHSRYAALPDLVEG